MRKILLLFVLLGFVSSSFAQSNGSFNHPSSKYVTPDNVVLQRDFVAEGKNYTMYCINNHKKPGKNSIEDIIFIPEDYKIVRYFDNEISCPPTLDCFVAHDLGDDTSFLGAIVYESIPVDNRYGAENNKREIKLPDELGEYIFKMMAGKTKYYLLPHITDQLRFVKTAKLYDKSDGQSWEFIEKYKE